MDYSFNSVFRAGNVIKLSFLRNARRTVTLLTAPSSGCPSLLSGNHKNRDSTADCTRKARTVRPNDFSSLRITDRETRVDVDAMTPEVSRVVQQAKVPLHPKDVVTSKKLIAVHKENKRKLNKQLNFGSTMDYSPMDIDKHEPEFGPCRRKLDGIIQGMKDTSRVMALSLYLPNCDRKGFFKRKQCKPSRGRKRGICWCVDKYGIQLPGTDYSGGDIQCKDLESSINE
ncbi:insulin-like growth factor-binding protein 5 isoform X2 [Fundulus heteroclitus]|uniref:insulin-like growth factor-binding protein 5 isoform X2 n=1 Tax=Fundulus heteroclitus TaxID=8078 RepID=UPI00165CCA40|nr:insulin-like growth factor-binding protein 5 isoform X2 [Fundulus heteroclitus]